VFTFITLCPCIQVGLYDRYTCISVYNRIERLNGTLRERVKVQRGWKEMKTPIVEGQRIQYNFVKPHQALEGQTPAKKVGIEIGNKNKWMDLLISASDTIPRSTKK
jgi:hypothetical protein